MTEYGKISREEARAMGIPIEDPEPIDERPFVAEVQRLLDERNRAMGITGDFDPKQAEQTMNELAGFRDPSERAQNDNPPAWTVTGILAEGERMILSQVPNCRERSLAITKIQECQHWVKDALAKS